MDDKIKIGVSTCLLGEKVRYDGGHKHDRYITETLGRFFHFVPVCPEVECGLPVPREAMRLVGDPDRPRLTTIRTKKDLTEQMTAWGRRKLEELEKVDLCGYIFKSKSPSSGMARVKIYTEAGMPSASGGGIWAKMFMDRFPLLPVEDEGRLHDPKLREMFIERVFVLKRWRDAWTDRPPTPAGLMGFHARHKLLFMSHSPDHYRRLGRIAAQAHQRPISDAVDEYLAVMTEGLGRKTTVKKNTNVLHHLLGYFKKRLTADEKREFLELTDAYARGDVPLIVPVTLINHWVRKYDQPYLRDQYYLNPHPLELQLRNHV